VVKELELFDLPRLTVDTILATAALSLNARKSQANSLGTSCSLALAAKPKIAFRFVQVARATIGQSPIVEKQRIVGVEVDGIAEKVNGTRIVIAIEKVECLAVVFAGSGSTRVRRAGH
jgi:hypothetical protein